MPRFRAHMRKTSRLLTVVAVALFALTACRGTVPISTLLDDPGRYDGKTVRVKGTVNETVGALGRGAYRVTDDTGTIGVLAQQGGAPREGARVGVEGEFKALFTFGDLSQAVLFEKRRFSP